MAVVVLVGSCPREELSWGGGGVVLGIVVLIGNGWALFLCSGPLSAVGSCPRTKIISPKEFK